MRLTQLIIAETAAHCKRKVSENPDFFTDRAGGVPRRAGRGPFTHNSFINNHLTRNPEAKDL